MLSPSECLPEGMEHRTAEQGEPAQTTELVLRAHLYCPGPGLLRTPPYMMLRECGGWEVGKRNGGGLGQARLLEDQGGFTSLYGIRQAAPSGDDGLCVAEANLCLTSLMHPLLIWRLLWFTRKG